MVQRLAPTRRQASGWRSTGSTPVLLCGTRVGITAKYACREQADSIREHGVREPILVAPGGNRYQVVAGNRRLQAARLAGLDRVAAVVLGDVDEPRQLLVNLVENVHRVDLKPTERIASVRQLAAPACLPPR
jgi:ParB/RepB/Spo0J family partition protein